MFGWSKDGFAISMTPKFAEDLLAAYDARGEELQLLRDNFCKFIVHEDREVILQARNATDSAVARVDGNMTPKPPVAIEKARNQNPS
jgi:hypothetical protein